MSKLKDRFSPYPFINKESKDFISKVGKVKYSFDLTPCEDGVQNNRYLSFHTHLAKHGVIMEAKVDEELYKSERKAKQIVGVVVKLTGLSNYGSMGASLAEEQMIAKSWEKTKKSREQVISFYYHEIKKIKIKTGFFRIIPTIEFHLQDDCILSFVPGYLPDRAPDQMIINLMEVAEFFVKKFKSLKKKANV